MITQIAGILNNRCRKRWQDEKLRLPIESQAVAGQAGGPSLGRSPDAHKQRRPFNQIENNRETGSTRFLEQGLTPCSSFLAGPLPEVVTSEISRGVASPRIASLTQCDLTPMSFTRYPLDHG